MGTINYGTSDYITIGYNCGDLDYNDPFYWENIQEDFEELTYILGNYNFYYFHVVIKSGYYEGFYVDIEHNYTYCYDSGEDKRAAQKEITQIKKFLLSCLDFGCCSVYPSWCMGYANREQTLKDIDAAIYNMREEVKQTPTWHTLKKYA